MKAKKPAQDQVHINVYERIVKVYDMVIGGKVLRWDDEKASRNYALMNKRRVKLRKISDRLVGRANYLVKATTPDALVRKRVIRKQVRNLPHEVQKAD